MEYIITFNNTNSAIKAEQCLLSQRLFAGVLPLPSQISAGCGICLRIKAEDVKATLGILKDNNINEIGLYTRVSETNGFIYTKEQLA
jgi:hypothetical protein